MKAQKLDAWVEAQNGTKTQALETVVINIVINDQGFTVHLNDGRHLTVPLAWYPRLPKNSKIGIY